MAWLKTSFKFVLAFFDLLLFSMSPLYILMFIVGVIVLMDQFGQYNSLLNYMENNSFVAQAEVIEPYDEELSWVMVKFTNQEGEQDYGFLRSKYHPVGVVQALQVNQQITIRYSDPSRDSNVVLEEYYRDMRDPLSGSWSFVRDPLIIMGISWVLIIFYPHFLYTGYAKVWEQVLASRWDLPTRRRRSK